MKVLWKKFLILILFMSSPILADQISTDSLKFQVKSNKGRDIFLSGEDCDKLEQQFMAIKEWLRRIGEERDHPEVSCSCNLPQKGCFIPLSGVSPRILREFHDVKPIYKGPNCFNASLVSSKILPSLRYASENEMKFWMESPLCRERRSDEPLRPGDVVAIRNKDNSEFHGFIYISPGLSFSKNGFSLVNPYALQSTRSVYAAYQVGPECERLYGRPSNNGCQRWANIYTCQTWDEYWKTHYSDERFEYLEPLMSMECHISVLAFGGHSINTPLSMVKTSIRALYNIADQKFNNKNISDDDKFFWGMMVKRLESLWIQVKNIEEQKPDIGFLKRLKKSFQAKKKKVIGKFKKIFRRRTSGPKNF